MYDGVSSKVEGDLSHVTKRVWVLDPVDGTKGKISHLYYITQSRSSIYLCTTIVNCIYVHHLSVYILIHTIY